MRCRIYQWLLSRRLAAGEPLPPRLRRHLAGCPACRTHRDELAAVTQRLRADAPDEPPLPAELTRRIMAAVESAAPEPQPRSRPRSRRPLVVALSYLGAAACVLLAVTLLPPGGSTPVEDGNRVARPAPTPPTPPSSDELTEPFRQDVERLAAVLVDAQVQRLTEDTRRFGSDLLARLPLGLLRTGDGEWIEKLVPPERAPGPERPGSGSRPRDKRPSPHPKPSGKIRSVARPLDVPGVPFISI